MLWLAKRKCCGKTVEKNTRQTSCWSIPQAQCVGVDSAPSVWHQLRVYGRGKGCCACHSLFLVQAGRTSNRKSVSEKWNGAEVQSWRKSTFSSPERFVSVQYSRTNESYLPVFFQLSRRWVVIRKSHQFLLHIAYLKSTVELVSDDELDKQGL